MESLTENDTWELVDKPDDRNIVSFKWVYRVKTNATGKIDKFKVRLVTKGYSQKEGNDYSEAFSPVRRFDTIRVMISVAAKEHMALTHVDVNDTIRVMISVAAKEHMTLTLVDVKTAFPYGKLEEATYINHPEGYDDGSGGCVS